MTTYVDTALFVKGFVLEADSAGAISIIERIGEPFLHSHLHETEIPNAIGNERLTERPIVTH